MRCLTRWSLAAAFSGAMLLAACGGGDDSNGPSTTGLGGTWRFAWPAMTGTVNGNALSCNVSGVTMVLVQTGATFSGTQSGSATMTCSANGQQVISQAIGGETIVNGTISGANVAFELGSIPGPHTGTLAGTSMSGGATWSIDLGGGTVVTMTGSWNAARR